MVVVHEFQLLRPVLITVNLIDEKVLASMSDEIVGQIQQAMVCKVEILGRDVQRGIGRQVLLDILQYECRLAHTARSGQSDHTAVPADAVVHIPMETGIRLQQQLAVSVL